LKIYKPANAPAQYCFLTQHIIAITVQVPELNIEVAARLSNNTNVFGCACIAIVKTFASSAPTTH
jgi:hypothetical protein